VSPTVRDRSDRLLRGLTWWIAGFSAIAAVVLAAVAAVTIPGSSDATAATTVDNPPAQSDPGGDVADDPPPVYDQPVQPLQPAQTYPQPAYGQPHGRSGGSH
jgi:hypothetical protein